jgi:hypothetical protein
VGSAKLWPPTIFNVVSFGASALSLMQLAGSQTLSAAKMLSADRMGETLIDSALQMQQAKHNVALAKTMLEISSETEQTLLDIFA